MAKVCIVTATVNFLNNFKAFKESFNGHEVDIIVVDEGDHVKRRKNKEVLSGLSYEFYGPRERKEWFKDRFNSLCEAYLDVIPKRCHAETSFGLAVAYEREPDFVIELDDDVFSVRGHNLVESHATNLFNEDGVTVFSRNKWYNTLENLKINCSEEIFPRGHPYIREIRTQNYNWINDGCRSFLNMGLWVGCPDLDAVTLLYHSDLDGKSCIKSYDCKRKKVIVGKEIFFCISSMNTSFLPDVIPAFYQLYMNLNGVDRFDDIWSGLFLKKIGDHLGHKLCLGEPLVYHDRRQRNIFMDLRKEFDGMVINEKLWSIVDELELDGNNYWDCYNSLIDGLGKRLSDFNDARHQKFLNLQLQKMNLWLELMDRLV